MTQLRQKRLNIFEGEFDWLFNVIEHRLDGFAEVLRHRPDAALHIQPAASQELRHVNGFAEPDTDILRGRIRSRR